ncbi:MAG: GHMP kinase [Nitrospinae bacterium]|nr:GHMP kinase [Nitrospinota bacterium]
MGKIVATAPARVDLAGGTLDIWPLNLFFKDTLTLNMAISISARAEVTPRRDGKIVLVSRDGGKRVEFKNLPQIKHNHPLGLLSRLVEKFIRKGGVEVVTMSEAPAGAGLAGSSALNIALCGALSRAAGDKTSKAKLIDIAKDVEAALLHTPTGLQDYAAAVFGGVNAFRFPAGGMQRASLDIAGKELERRLILFYSGQSRNSGINNWEMFKRVIDKDRRAMNLFAKIAGCAVQASEALADGDFKRFEKAVASEWKARRSLFPSISTDVIDGAIQAGVKAGARAARICGAGGGGCFFVLAEPGSRRAVIEAVEKLGPRHLPFTLSTKGLRVYNARKD